MGAMNFTYAVMRESLRLQGKVKGVELGGGRYRYRNTCLKGKAKELWGWAMAYTQPR